MAGYLFVHFTGEQKDGEQVYFAISRDGLFWQDLYKDRPILISDIGEKGARDPFPIKDEENGKYYIIATDLRIESGMSWLTARTAGSTDLLVWESEDLIHWSKVRAVHPELSGIGCVWAPEAIYDPEKKAFLVFWSSCVKGERERGKFKIFASYTKDFTVFSPVFTYVEKPCDVIDMTIIRVGEHYVRFLKDEESKYVFAETGEHLCGDFVRVESETLDQLRFVEGPEGYLLPDGKTWCLIVDRFAEGKGYLPLLSQCPEEGCFRIAEEGSYDFGKNLKRHGGILRLTDEEYDRLAALAQLA